MIYVKITEKEEGFLTDLHDMDNFSQAIVKKFSEIGLLKGYHAGFSVNVTTKCITIQFRGITAAGETINFIVRNISNVLDTTKLSDFLLVSECANQSCIGDKILHLNDFKPGETKNSLLLKDILPIDKVPQDYQCQLSSEIMDNPVHTTKRPDIFYNKKHLTYWLYSQDTPLDPYTRQTIDPIKDVIIDKEKKKEIDNFVSKNLREGLIIKRNKFCEIVKKHTGEEKITQATIDKAFRTAAAKNEVKDLDTLWYKISSIDAQDNNPQRKRTALHWAIDKKSVDCVKWLLNKKANINIPDAQNKTALDYANHSNNDDIKKLVTGQTTSQVFQGLRTQKM